MQTAHQNYHRWLKLVFLSGILAVLAAKLAGCSSPEGGSSMPWTQTESWEQQPRFGVPY